MSRLFNVSSGTNPRYATVFVYTSDRVALSSPTTVCRTILLRRHTTSIYERHIILTVRVEDHDGDHIWDTDSQKSGTDRIPSAPMTRSVSCVVPSENRSIEREALVGEAVTEVHRFKKCAVVRLGSRNLTRASRKDALHGVGYS